MRLHASENYLLKHISEYISDGMSFQRNEQKGFSRMKRIETTPTGAGVLVGYARVSTRDQDTALQLDALTAAGCDRIFTEKASGAQRDRPELHAALDYMRPDDTLVVWKLDRLARSLKQLIETVEGLHERNRVASTSTGKSERGIPVMSPQAFMEEMDDGELVCFIGKKKPFRLKSMDARRHRLLAQRLGMKQPERLLLPPLAASQQEHPQKQN
jgi:hypothetical protein